MKSCNVSKRGLGSIILAIALSATNCFAAVINVPTDQPTIAAAVTNANAGDVIIIAPGTYIEQSEIIIDKQLTISSQWHTAGDTQFINQTVLDGVNKTNTIFKTINNQGVNVEISGLTFTRFQKPIVINDIAVIKNNVFTNNGSDSISFESKGFGYVGFNTIEDSGDDGIDLDAQQGTFTIEFNTIRNNADDGIEIRLFTGPQTNITYDIHDNILKGNDEDGIQLIDHASEDSGRVFNIYNNVIDSNSRAGLGCMSDGVTNEDFSGADILERVNFYNNTVINNTVGVTGGDNFIALNNIIANNTNEGMKRMRANSVIAHSIFFNNGTHIADAITDAGIILDVDPEYDLLTYQLLLDSPSINSGVAVFDWNGEQVLNRDPSEFTGLAPDLGAKESGNNGSAGNTSPNVSAGNNQVIFEPSNSTVLQGQISDDGLPNPPGEVITTWTQEDGPGVATFVDESIPSTTVSFSQQGKYQLRLRGDDSELAASDSVVVRYASGGSGNTIPIQFPGTTFFEAEDYAYIYGMAQEVSDINASGDMAIEAPDGFGTNAFSEHTLVITDQNVTYHVWIRGKGFDQNSNSVMVSFKNSAETQVNLSSNDTYNWFQVPGSFTVSAGSWPLIIRAGEDGVIWDQVIFTTDPNFIPNTNQAPTVAAGSNQSITLLDIATLDGTVSDDGLPQAGSVTTSWSKVSGPGSVTFGNTNAIDTTANFSDSGTYVLRLDADDSELSNSDEVTITVTPSGQINTLEARVAASSDDAEENLATGSVNLGSSDLELVNQGSMSQLVGMRFNNLNLPQNATITNAYIQFQTDEITTNLTNLSIEGEATDNTATFTSTIGNISSRPRTSSISWDPAPWTTVGENGIDQRTPNITSIIQEIIDRQNWVNGHSLTIIISGNGARTAESFNGDSAGAPLLHVEYITGEIVNQAPTVSAGSNQTITLPNAATLNATISDDGLPEDGSITTTWSQVSGPSTTTFANVNAVNTTASFSDSGTYVLRLTADDSELSNSDEVTITVTPSGQINTLETRVAASSDDAEENIATGSVNRGSSDLELVNQGSISQLVGMRFNNLNLPQNATITNAYIQFQTDEITTNLTNLIIEGEATDNAATFTSAIGNISSRPRTSSISWNPAPWTTVGENGIDQRTPNITSIIQEIIGRQNWANGHSLAIIISGNGARTAESFNGDAAGAPLLHVEYITGAIVNQAPTVSAGSNQTITLPNAATLNATVSDDGLPQGGSVTSTWSQVSGPGTTTFANVNAVDTTASFSASGTYVLRLDVDDSELSNSDEVTITVTDVSLGVIFQDDFETDLGWTTNPAGSDTASTGRWQVANPSGTSLNGVAQQLGTTTSGSQALVTDGRAGSSVGSYDIDGGVTSVRSPNIELPTGADLMLSFNYYMAHLSNSSSADFLRITVVGPTGSQVVYQELGAGNNDAAAWVTYSGSLNQFAGQTIYFLVEAADASNGSLVEAGIDDLLIEAR